MIEALVEHAGLVGLLFFFSFFLVVVLWTYRPGAHQLYKSCADIPLKGEEK